MKKAISLFALELRLIIKQSLLFLLIATIVFSLALGVYSFSNDLMDNYYREIDRDIAEFGSYRFFAEMHSADSVRNVIPYSNGAHIWNGWEMAGVLSDISFFYGDNVFNTTNTSSKDTAEWRFFSGSGIIFQNDIYALFPFIDGRGWSESDNYPNNGFYNIFISSMIAGALGASYGSIVSISPMDSPHVPSRDVKIAGVFGYCDDIISTFFYFPLNLVLDMHDVLSGHGEATTIPVSFEINSARALHSFYRTLRNAYEEGKVCSFNIPWIINSIEMMRIAEAVLMALAYLMIVIAFFILSNILSILINSRGEFIAKLKLLGANSTTISILYYIVFLSLFVVSFAIAIGLNFVMLNYYASVATNLFDFEFLISARPLAIFYMFLASLGLIAIRYIFFRRRISKIEPLTLLRS
ncbi:MAG: hypothetical protein FWC11_01950 [Firmicutes bacterium]|nr:hypothetical protein [Bacillota bacterium]MCL2255604.1 hypothetical protein [Bacillota bacterium]